MKADKVVVTIKMEALSIEVLPYMLTQVIENINKDVERGALAMADGDEITWVTERIPVEF